MPERYAVYYAPKENEPLSLFARSWLGRDALTGREHPQPDPRYLPASALRQVTASPRHYGFHATLKPPFILAQGRTAPDLADEMAEFAKETPQLSLPSLALKWIGGFLAIVPRPEPKGLLEFAGECVRRLDAFRAPPSREETEKRLAAGLTQRQKKLLSQWGYPYVMEEFRFHMTLTGNLRDTDLKHRVQREADDRLGDMKALGLTVDSICLFSQPELDRPFTLVRRFILAGV